jgi:predicted PurR-regulated permease PerM
VLAVLAHPLHVRLVPRFKRKAVPAALTLLFVTVTLLAPLAFVTTQIARQAIAGAETAKEEVASGRWRTAIERNPRLAPALKWIDREVDLQTQLASLFEQVLGGAKQFLSASFYVVAGWLITFFLVFYFLRDRGLMLASLREYLPLTAPEANRVFRETRDTIYAIVYGTIVVAIVQGTLGGLMFWWLGLPAPLLWGTVMAVLAILPVLGAAIVWIPAAAFLLLEGSWEKALLLTAWGGIAVALIDNLMYPLLVKDRLRLHTVPVFLAIVGGLVVFGAAGLVLGPVVLVLTFTLVEIYRHHLPHAEPNSDDAGTKVGK